MTLTKRYVKKSRKDFYCDDCNKLIPKGSSYTFMEWVKLMINRIHCGFVSLVTKNSKNLQEKKSNE